MPDWDSPEELARDAAVFVKFMHAMLGVYAWEWFISLDFDFDFIRGRKKFRWPMIFYFANRYILLFALIGIAISQDTFKEIDCQALFTFNQLAGNAAAGLASINLSLRTIAVYHNATWVVVTLIVLILGHWSLILQGVLLNAQWSPEAQSCAITKTNTKVLVATFVYSMSFDLIVLLLNAYKLVWKSKRADRLMGTSQIAKLIFGDGLIYFFIAFIANLIATVFMILNLNQIMNVIFNVPAVIASTIVACRVVRRLSNFTNRGPEVFSSSVSNPNIQFRSANPPNQRTNLGGGVHVQMETFRRADDDLDVEAKAGSDVTDVEDLELRKGQAL